MIRLIHRPRPVVFVLSLLCVVLVGATAAGAAPTAANPVGPVLTAAAAPGDAPNTLVVTGEGFTPDGRVYVALSDRPGAGPDETRLSAETPIVSGTNGSADPAAGFIPGGLSGPSS
jgi:hypothetical protein